MLILSLTAISCDELIDQLNLDFTVGPHRVEFTIEPANQGDIFNEFDVYIHELTEEVEAKGGKMDQLDKVSLKVLPLVLYLAHLILMHSNPSMYSSKRH